MGVLAVVNYGLDPGSVALREVEVPDFGPTDILLKVEAVSVCGSDLHQWMGTHSWPVNYPVTLGHEFGGTIAEMGSEVDGFSTGDRVVSETAAVVDLESPLTKGGSVQPRSVTKRIRLRRERRDDALCAGACPMSASRSRPDPVRAGCFDRALLRRLQFGDQSIADPAG